jgi:hypothetical protein
MQGLAASSKLSLTVVVVVFLLGFTGTAHCRKSLVSSDHPEEQCQKMTLYLHDFLFNSTTNNMANATSATAANPSALSNSTYFGMLVVFDDPVTEGKELPVVGKTKEPVASFQKKKEPVARAQGFYFYDKKDSFNAWYGLSFVFNSTAHNGIINLMGAGLMGEKMRDLYIAGGTRDFFMARGVATLRTDAFEGMDYFRLRVDIELYVCYL